MGKWMPYALLGAALLLVGLLIYSSRNSPRTLDERVTLRQADQLPYGTEALKRMLPTIFPAARVHYDRKAPAYWDSINTDGSGQAVILVSGFFNADTYELHRLVNFVNAGNHVLLITRGFSYDASQFFDFTYYVNNFEGLSDESGDSLRLRLEPPAAAAGTLFVYPGKKFESYFYTVDTAHTRVLGRTANGQPNFIQMKSGKGSLFVHMAPLAFSNYFILHKENHRYVSSVLSYLPPDVTDILWNEYYLVKPGGRKQKEPNWMRVLMRYPAFKWGLFTGIFGILLYVLLGMRRRQQMIPPHGKPRNESLDFVKTLGRLYFDKGDHRNLAIKMGHHFLEYVRTHYKMPTTVLDDTFIQNLHYKSGYGAEELKNIVQMIHDLPKMPAITERQLHRFYGQLQMFYQNT